MTDPGSFEEWYRAAHPRLVRSLTVFGGDLDAATEAAAEACARCLTRWDRKPGLRDPTAWTYRVGVNLLHRRWSRRRRDSLVTVERSTMDVVLLPEPAIELWDAVGRLPHRARLAVVLRYIGGMTEPQIAAAMGVAPGTVSATLHAARKRLATELASLNTPEATMTITIPERDLL